MEKKTIVLIVVLAVAAIGILLMTADNNSNSSNLKAAIGESIIENDKGNTEKSDKFDTEKEKKIACQGCQRIEDLFKETRNVYDPVRRDICHIRKNKSEEGFYNYFWLREEKIEEECDGVKKCKEDYEKEAKRRIGSVVCNMWPYDNIEIIDYSFSKKCYNYDCDKRIYVDERDTIFCEVRVWSPKKYPSPKKSERLNIELLQNKDGEWKISRWVLATAPSALQTDFFTSFR